MHKNFAEWYRILGIEPDGAKLQKRWAGVKAWADALRSDDEGVLETVRIFQGLPSRSSRDPFVAVFQKLDPAFPQRNDLELRVLAGASIVACIQGAAQPGKHLRAAVLAGSALEASSLRIGKQPLTEIASEVLEGLHDVAVIHRRRRPFDPKALRARLDVTVEAMKQIPSIANWDTLKNVITPIFQSLVDALEDADDGLADAAHNLRGAEEETNILWWVEGGFSRDTNRPWAALKDGVAIIAGSELADLTDVALGHRNSVAVLDRVLSAMKAKGKDAALASYVNAIPDDWARNRAAKADRRALDLTPLSHAVLHRGNSNPTSWQQIFDASSLIASSVQLTPAEVARQAYCESILLRTLAEVQTEE